MSVVENFEKLLTDFFSLYHPRQVKKVGLIVQEFKGQEVAVLKALCDKYKKSYKVVPGLEDALAAPALAPLIEEPVAIEEANEELADDLDELEASNEVIEEEVEEEEEEVEEEEEKN